MIARRSFLKQAGLTLAAAAGARTVLTAATSTTPARSGGHPGDPLRLGMAGYSFNRFNLEQTLKMMQTVDVHYLCIKDFHLPFQSTDEQIAAFHAQCRAANVTGYGVGPIYMGSETEAANAFEYARRVGVKLVVGVPYKLVDKKRVASPELLEFIELQVARFDMKYAIHNHGPDTPELFPTAESAMALIDRLDSRIGLCLDIGHELRDGKDPVQSMERFANRVHDLHIKNVTAASKEGRSIEMPRGVIDLAAFVRTLRQVGYAGVCSLEHEKDMDNPLAGIAESIGYFRGLMDATRPAI